MVWYADGSIQVAANGQVATGTGTAFLKNVRAGDGLTIAGSASMHEVTNIASDTQLTFSPPYTGAAGSGKQYRIAPIQGYVKEAADLLRALTQNLGSFANNANLTALAAAVGAANKGLMFTAPGAIGTFDLSAQGRAFLGAASQAAQQSALGLVPTTSYLDQTPGRVAMLDPNGRGFHGLGNSETVPILSDFKGLNRTCFGLFTTSTLNGPPVGSNGGFMNIYANAADTGYQVMFAGSYGSPDRWAFGKKTGNANPVWAEAWHEKNQLAIGTTALSARTALEINQGLVLSSLDFNSGLYIVTGQYTLPSAVDSSFSNYPPASPGLSRASLRVYSTGGYITQELTTIYGRKFDRACVAGSWSTWSESWGSRSLPVQSSITDTTSGAAVLNGGHGLGASGIYRNSISEVNLSRGSEFFINSAVPASNPFPAPYISGIHCCYGSPASGYAVQFVGGVTTHRYFVRYQTNGTWAAAVELWHTGNLTPNKLEDRTQATLPTASANKGQMFNCTNTTTRGERPVYSDGSVWRRLEDSSLITAA
ncbi:pyocin knob domain-containing protein [Pseudomonas sp. G34]|uniref:pyocin knob domain-containing protein n=1 Tax=Pseudomonas sp. G34 TaxID=3059083 RepID=UPI002809B0BE|nr:pyocin knob domain-containing protein [Pseudomonas sp. G34]MDQ7987084.1 pyocin knob domain-containing protein [Pseudomonas sp. G34]